MTSEEPSHHQPSVPLSEGQAKTGRAPVVKDDIDSAMVEALRDRESQYRHLVENLPAGVVVHGPDSAILFGNQNAATLLGLSLDQMMGVVAIDPSYWCFVHDDGKPMPVDDYPVRQVIRSGKRIRGIVVGVHRPGDVEPAWFLVNAFPEFDADQNLLRVVVVFIDTTAHKRTEIALRHSREFVRATMDSLSSQVCVLDKRGTILAVNRAWREYGEKNGAPTGNGCEGTNYLDVCENSPQDPIAVQFSAGIRAVISGQREYFELDYPCHSPTQNQWFVGRVTRFTGGPEGSAVVSHENVTERELAEEALRASESLFASIFHASPIPITLKRLDDERLIDVNAAWEALTGLSREQSIGKRSFDLNVWAEPEARARLIDELRESGRLQGREVSIIDQNGVIHTVLMSAELIRAADEPCILTLGMDITDRKRAEEALSQTQEQLRQSQKLEAVGQLAGGVAHDFRNQLTIIRGFIDLLQDERTAPDERPAMFAEVRKAVDRSSDLTADLLAFSRRQALAPQPLDVRQVIRDLAKSLPTLLGEDIRVEVLSDPAPCIAIMDAGQLHQALLNLATNARDAMPGGGTLTIQTTLIDRDNPALLGNPEALARAYLLIRVQDTGVGMDESIRTKIFEPFFTTKPVGQGTGLGLPMVYGFIKQSGGFITVTSRRDGGSQFCLFVPRSETMPLPVKSADVATPPAISTGTILVVEDEAGLLKVAVVTLRRLGYTVHAAADPATAMAFLQHNPTVPDLLLTDLVMSGGSGLDLGQKVRQLHPSTTILYMSGYAERDLAARGLREVPGRFLLKPFSIKQLAESVRSALEERERGG